MHAEDIYISTIRNKQKATKVKVWRAFPGDVLMFPFPKFPKSSLFSPYRHEWCDRRRRGETNYENAETQFKYCSKTNTKPQKSLYKEHTAVKCKDHLNAERNPWIEWRVKWQRRTWWREGWAVRTVSSVPREKSVVVPVVFSVCSCNMKHRQ